MFKCITILVKYHGNAKSQKKLFKQWVKVYHRTEEMLLGTFFVSETFLVSGITTWLWKHSVIDFGYNKFVVSEVTVTQVCPTLCDPMDYTVHGILQARILEWVAFPFSSGSSQPRDRTQVSHIAGSSWDIRKALS